MVQVATFMAPEATLSLSDKDIQAAAKALAKAGGRPLDHNWLAKGEAFDIVFEGKGIGADTLLVCAGFSAHPVDCIVQEAGARAKRFIVADMDSTIIAQECIDEIAAELNLKEKIAPITEAAMQGRLDFKAALIERVGLLKGLEKQALERVLNTRISYTPGAETLLKTLKAEGIKTALVSGGFTFFTRPVARDLGFDLGLSNVLEFSGDTLTGKVRDPIVDSAAKRRFLTEEAKRLGIPIDRTLAVGDGANDIPMFEAAGFSIAYHGKEAARKAAKGNLQHTDLTGILFALGIARDKFQI